MAKKKNKFIDLTSDTMRIMLIVLGSIFATLVLTFAVMAITSLDQSNLDAASYWLLGVFIVLGISRFFTFLKMRSKVSFIRFITLLVVDITLGVVISFAHLNYHLFSIVGGLYCISVILSRIFIIFQKRTVRTIIFNGILILLFTFLAIGLFMPFNEDEIPPVVLLICLIIVISSFIEVFSNATTSLKLKVLVKIILRTFALEVILGLVTLMVAFSLIFTLYEPTIASFPDALWYSFAVVTTIGFGDFAAETLIGRILTVILGMYGIFVVAVITSIIVNFYNETAGKKDAEELKEIKEEEDLKK